MRRIGSDDLPLFVTAVAIQGSTGGNLGEILENLSGVIRQRFKMRRKIRALAAEGRASAMILSALPIGMFIVIQFISPDFYASVWSEHLTKVLLFGAAGLDGGRQSDHVQDGQFQDLMAATMLKTESSFRGRAKRGARNPYSLTCGYGFRTCRGACQRAGQLGRTMRQPPASGLDNEHRMFGDSATTMLSVLIFLAAGTLAFAVMIGMRAREAVRRRAARVGVEDGAPGGRRSLRFSGLKAAQKLVDYTTKHYSAADTSDMKMLRRRLMEAGIYDPHAAAYYFLARGADAPWHSPSPRFSSCRCSASAPRPRSGCSSWAAACSAI